MIVCCPRCKKQYKIDVNKIDFIRMPGNNTFGVQLSCSNCKEQWWETKSNMLSASGVDKSNNQVVLNEFDYKNLTNVSELFIDKNFRIINNLNYKENLSNNSYNYESDIKDEKLSKRILFLGFLFFTSIVVAGFFILNSSYKINYSNFIHLLKNLANYTQETSTEHVHKNINIADDKQEKSQTVKNINQPQKILNNTKEKDIDQKLNTLKIEIDSIKYNFTKSKDLGYKKILIIAVAKNRSSKIMNVDQFEVKVLKTCNDGETPDQGNLCISREWFYESKKKQLNPGESEVIKIAANIRQNDSVKKVLINVK